MKGGERRGQRGRRADDVVPRIGQRTTGTRREDLLVFDYQKPSWMLIRPLRGHCGGQCLAHFLERGSAKIPVSYEPQDRRSLGHKTCRATAQ